MCGPDYILRHTLAPGIHCTESELRDRKSLVSRASISVRSLRIVLRDRLPELVEGPKQILC